MVCRAISAQAIRAVLLANATATTSRGRLASRPGSGIGLGRLGAAQCRLRADDRRRRSRRHPAGWSAEPGLAPVEFCVGPVEPGGELQPATEHRWVGHRGRDRDGSKRPEPGMAEPLAHGTAWCRAMIWASISAMRSSASSSGRPRAGRDRDGSGSAASSSRRADGARSMALGSTVTELAKVERGSR